MIGNIREQYKVYKTPTQQSYEYELGLKHNKEYEKRVDETFIEIAKLLIDFCPNIQMESPREREKSSKSLKGKIKKLEIERLCKLYEIEGLDRKQKVRLHSLLIEKIQNESNIQNDKAKKIIDEVLYGRIEDLETIHKLMEKTIISDNTKTAFLRITKTRLRKEEIKNNKKLDKELEEKYGETAAEKANIPEKNLLHWECIEETKNDNEKLSKLHDPLKYLIAKDLRGIKFIISHVPEDINIDSEELRELIKKRKEAPEEEKQYYNDLCCILLAEEFVHSLISNEELLEKLNLNILTDGYKHKTKSNGYIAEHIKFCYRDHPEYIFEVQFRSMYREELSRANGPAAHDKRAGKKRIFPNTNNRKIFIEELEDMIPKYKMLKRRGNDLYLEECTPLANMLQYYLGYIDTDSREYKKAIEYLTEENEMNK